MKRSCPKALVSTFPGRKARSGSAQISSHRFRLKAICSSRVGRSITSCIKERIRAKRGTVKALTFPNLPDFPISTAPIFRAQTRGVPSQILERPQVSELLFWHASPWAPLHAHPLPIPGKHRLHKCGAAQRYGANPSTKYRIRCFSNAGAGSSKSRASSCSMRLGETAAARAGEHRQRRDEGIPRIDRVQPGLALQAVRAARIAAPNSVRPGTVKSGLGASASSAPVLPSPVCTNTPNAHALTAIAMSV
jgi:hypothetical protein